MFSLSRPHVTQLHSQNKEKKVSFFSYIRMPLIFSVCFICAAYALISSKTFMPLPITRVQIIDKDHYVNKTHLQEILLPDVSKGFFTVNLKKIQKDLSQEPWIQTALVTRKWPGDLLITIEEQKPSLRWNQNDYINDKGELFTPQNKPDLSLPQLIGPDFLLSKELQLYESFSHILQVNHLSIDKLIVSDRLSWELTLNNGLILKLGREDLLTRMHRFNILYDKLTPAQKQDIEIIDLRYNNGAAVKWKKAARQEEDTHGKKTT